MSSTIEDVKSVLASVLGIQDRADTLTDSTELFGALPELDSMAVIELVVALEQKFDVKFDDDEVTGEVFETLGSLAGLIDAKRRG